MNWDIPALRNTFLCSSNMEISYTAFKVQYRQIRSRKPGSILWKDQSEVLVSRFERTKSGEDDKNFHDKIMEVVGILIYGLLEEVWKGVSYFEYFWHMEHMLLLRFGSPSNRTFTQTCCLISQYSLKTHISKSELQEKQRFSSDKL